MEQNMVKDFDSIIIGAGVVGVSIFNELVRRGYKCLLIDKAYDVATGASKANSGLIHAGFDAPEGSLKARFNVQGNKLYPAICKRLGLPLKKIGALVVGDDYSQVDKLYHRGLANGVKNLQILNREQLLDLEPHLSSNITCGLYAKDSYIISPYLLTICLTEEAIVNGGEVWLNTQVEELCNKDKYELHTSSGTVYATNIINCAGAGYNQIAKILGTEQKPLSFRRGEYYVLDSTQQNLVSHTVFPLPTNKGKGILITPTVDGNILVGPTSEVSENITKTTKEGLDEIKNKQKLLIDNLNLQTTIRVFSGIRVSCGADFVIEKSKKQPNIINVAGICSPGLSSAPAIAIAVAEILNYADKKIATKPIKPYFLFKDLIKQQKQELLAKDPNYSRIICKCENITAGDILFALKRPLKVVSTDGIKRRVRAGMGRCQGGFCLDGVISLLARQNKISLNDVLKENSGSNHIISNIRGNL